MRLRLAILGTILALGALIVATGCSSSETSTSTVPGGETDTTATTGGNDTTAATAPAKPAPEYITFGDADAFSGWASADAELNQYSNYDLWAEEVNAKGGIYVKEYDKRIPVKMIYYDNKSDPATAVKMYEKLMLQDKVDFVVAPWGTAWHFATAPLANQYGYQMIGVTVSSNALVSKAAKGELPFYFTNWRPPADVAPDLVNLLSELGVKKVAILYVSTLYGIEYYASLGPLLSVAGIETPVVHSYPFDILDTSPMLKEAQAANVDAIIAPSYGPDGALMVEQMKALNYNPKLVWLGSASWGSPTYIEKFGKAGIEGIMSEMGWNTGAAAGGQEYWDKYVAKYNREPDVGCGPIIYATMQVYEQAIEKAGTLDRAKVRDVMASEEFDTIQGKVKFTNNYNADAPFVIGQWRDGVYVAAMPEEKRSGDVLYPKPDWTK